MRNPSHILALVFVLAACGDDTGRDAGAYLFRDSAGIVVVENSRAAWAPGTEWRLSEEPVLRIGTAEGDSAHDLYRVTASLRMPDGRVVVANSGTSELRFFDSDGRFLFRSGRPGEGPGEYERISILHRIPGDSLLVWDSGNRRLSVLDADGRFVRSFPPGPFAGRPVFVSIVAPLRGGSLLLGAFGLRSAQTVFPIGLSRDTVVLLECDRAGEPIDTVGRYAGMEWYTTAEFPRMDLPYARDTYIVAHGDGFYLGDNATWEFSLRARDGRPLRVVRAAFPLTEVTEQDVAEQKQRWLADVSRGSRQEVARMLEPVEGPPTMPAFSALEVDAVGNVWLQHFEPVPGDSVIWSVFDPEGVMLGPVRMPSRFLVHEIGENYVLGRWRDASDVELVLLYELIRI